MMRNASCDGVHIVIVQVRKNDYGKPAVMTRAIESQLRASHTFFIAAPKKILRVGNAGIEI